MRQIRTLAADIFFLFLLVLLVLISFLSYQRIAKSNDAYNAVYHTSIVKLKLQQVMSSLNEAETAQRGFLLTKDSSFFVPYKGTQQRTGLLVHELDSLTRDNKQQQANVSTVKRLSALLYERLDYNLLSIDKPLSETLPFLADGNRYMRQVRSKIGEMTFMEDELLKRRMDDRNRYAAITPLYTLLFSIFGIGMVTIVYFRLRNETRLRFRAEDNEAAIHKFFLQVPAMVAILKGANHQFEFANPSYLALIGRSDIVGKPVREVLPEVEGQGYFELLDNVFKTRDTFTGKEMPFQVHKGNGILESAFINFTYQAIINVQGRTEGILVFCYDVSEMVATRKKIEETEQRLRLAIEAAEIGTFDWDFARNKFLSSPRLTEIFGFSDAAGTTHTDLLSTFHPDDKQKRDQAVMNSYEKGSLVYEARIIWPDKTIHWVNVYGKVIYNPAREPLRMYGTVLDITSQKSVLEEIRESESKFRLLADSLPQQIWTRDEQGNFTYFNEAVFDFTGQSLSNLQNGGWAGILHPDDQLENRSKWERSLETGEEYVMEHRFRNKDGRYRWQLSRATPQKDSAGKTQRWVGTSTDIQEQRNFVEELELQVFERTKSLQQANADLEITVQELEKMNGELESFNYIASHDLQEPLRKIIAFTQRINDRDKDNLSDLSKDYFVRITGAAARMQNLIDAFLSYSRNTGTHSLFEQVDLNLIVEEVKSDLSNLIEEKHAVITSDLLPSIAVIRIQFHQLFVNIINNALKYSKPGISPVIQISSSIIPANEADIPDANKRSDYYKINFTDNGIGFEQQYVNKIFQLFQRLHGKTEYAGTGIGLAICKKIMDNHKGYISAVGTPGSGSVFTLLIPVSNI